jgi:EAL domain-containing protein (putative c-di-GMP-specific phosphodiesterase class I)
MIQQLTDLGIGVALDDFGTGFSSLSYLALLNPMIIKIDQSFVRPMMKTIHSDRLLETIVSLGHNLGMTMLAEGIETPDQLEKLRELHCSLGQGYLFSPAVAFDDAVTMVGTSFSF